MTVKEFLQLKRGDIVEFNEHFYGIKRGTVRSCTWHNECCGFELHIDKKTGEETFYKELSTGRKYLEVAFIMDDGYMRYVGSNRLDMLEDMRFLELFSRHFC